MASHLHGPTASLDATARALARIDEGVTTVVLVEGHSDELAVEAAAALRGLDLGGTVVLPMGGAHAVGGFARRLGHLRLVGLCDAREAAVFRRALDSFFVCVEDLEDELLRAVGLEGAEALFEERGELAALRSLQRQAAWHGVDASLQVRRFLGNRSRKLRYAGPLVEAAGARDALPAPLEDLLAALC